ncbi:MAG: hypothetical protein ACHBN1_38665, partial [Heteroscytonema crispum UTEX LB 1556]
MYQQSAENLANEISKGNGNVFYVFNPLGWIRSDYADIRYSGTDDFRIIDITTGDEIAAQKIIKNNNSFIRIWAKDVPAVGYRIFEIKKGISKKPSAAAKFKNGTLQSSAYKIRITKSGAITSWIDLATKKELVKKVNNRYLNDAGFTLINEGDELKIENEGPVSTTVKAVSSHPFKHTTRITVFKNNRRIEIEDSILQNFRDLKTWAYSFNFTKPVTRHEELSAVLTA